MNVGCLLEGKVAKSALLWPSLSRMCDDEMKWTRRDTTRARVKDISPRMVESSIHPVIYVCMYVTIDIYFNLGTLDGRMKALALGGPVFLLLLLFQIFHFSLYLAVEDGDCAKIRGWRRRRRGVCTDVCMGALRPLAPSLSGLQLEKASSRHTKLDASCFYISSLNKIKYLKWNIATFEVLLARISKRKYVHAHIFISYQQKAFFLPI